MSERVFRNDTGNRYIILGGGVAAASAAEAIRARDDTGEIVMLTDEPMGPYSRPMLTKRLGDGVAAVPVHRAEWYEQRRIDLRTGARVLSLDAHAKEVRLAGGDVMRYDRCVYALGAECFVPPVPGVDGEQCTCVRRQADVEAIERRMPGIRSAAVIGGGVLGLEIAWALGRRGIAVSVVEVEARLMPRQLEEDVSARLKAAAEEAGVRVYTGAATERIEPGRVLLSGGGEVPAELVVLSCGIRANTDIACGAGLCSGRAVAVDAHMRTSADGVFACGDCAEFDGVDMGLWPEAVEQGRVAGANAAGDMVEYRPQRYPVSFVGFGLKLFDGRIR